MGNRSQGDDDDDDDDDAQKNGQMIKKKERIRRAEMERVRRREEEEEEEKPCSSSLDKFPERTSLNRVLDFNITADGFLAAVCRRRRPSFLFYTQHSFRSFSSLFLFLFLRFDSLALCFLSFYPCFAIFVFSIFAERRNEKLDQFETEAGYLQLIRVY
jgi:hypothetical protein